MPLPVREAIRDVWNNNLEESMRELRRLVDTYPYVAIDCEFPAVVARPIGKFKTSTDYHYQTMRCNVEFLRLIQLGITLVNDVGEVAQECMWQFNFYFNTDEDTYEPASIDALSKAGLDFTRHRTHGIQPNDFAELMITSGLVLSDETTWISYHGAYDFGYLLRILTGAPLPLTEEEFFGVLQIWFPSLYDIKYIMRQIKPSIKGGLQDIAQELGVTNLPQNSNFTSGFASYLAATTFHKIIAHYIQPASMKWDISSFQGALYGLGSTYVSGVLDNSRTTLTSAERERPGTNGHIPAGGSGGVPSSLASLVGVMSPTQVTVGHQNSQANAGHLGALGASTVQHYAQIHAAAAAAAAAGGHLGTGGVNVGVGGVGVGGVGGMGVGGLGMMNNHPMHHHSSHHHHPHANSNFSGLGSSLGGGLGGLGGLGVGVGHHMGGSSGSGGGSAGNTSQGGQAAGGSSGQGSGQSGQQGQQGGQQGGQGVYGMVPGVNSYVPAAAAAAAAYGLGGMGGLGMPGAYGGVPGINPYFTRDR
ncbi:CAF1-domain-containing protein [Serendipita vermifera]|nr:CAF1-domain-containing protein [Serendipita vermifera]